MRKPKDKNERYKIPVVTEKEIKKRRIKDVLLFVLPIAALLILFKVCFLIGVIPSASMEPLMNTDSAIVGNRLAYKFNNPQRGDVIVFKKGSFFLTKRIIGIPGDVVSIQHGIVYINEQPIVEDYVADGEKTEPLIGINTYTVPENAYFVMGDNRSHSDDSRAWEEPYVYEDDIVAKVVSVFSVNPFSHGAYYRGVGNVNIEETYSGAPKYDPSNIVTETTASETDEPEEGKQNLSPTLPAASIEPESVVETVEESSTDALETETIEGEEDENESVSAESSEFMEEGDAENNAFAEETMEASTEGMTEQENVE